VSAGYIVAVGLFLGGLVVRDIYELLKKSGRIDTRNARVFALVFVSMCVMWIAWFGMGLLDPVRPDLPAALTWLGLAAVIVGWAVAIGGLWQLRALENVDHLVTTGLFSKIRHPMYVGFILWIVGWSVYQGVPLTLAIGSVGVISILWWRHLEETALESCYGRAYTEYRATTWF
jgi:protein-S-isoprenylcysteine O-methyltransferase Ste14